mmetsp:Transcript_63796/g.75497  ORF Transcript_63796/g.75497 Transcript_63796/m.75497 type:complete len:460 (+) Transcript_63796:100-1479(+)|eukprot:CAMPEP_0172500984 /NCGR_PEP_ID=MMETSP1066-20121228/144903_1 /TAXON_ID=671091 /ORGANISM="Coscinodiscus wailesii, Strain CCMP2513" /LENGTH=459 /DNA_ID=CAMNT_0013275529 /DNA_START=81 /DNA_END=1460 /DNA_ORIENTATION=-
MPPNQGLINIESLENLAPLQPHLDNDGSGKIRCAILGCGMMGQEHISYISGYDNLRIDFLCDPHQPSLDKSVQVLRDFHQNDKGNGNDSKESVATIPELLSKEEDLLEKVDEIDLLVIASPNYLHTASLLQWTRYDITILVEKPVAVSKEQHDKLQALSREPDCCARIWVAMEYRYIPAISKLLSLLPSIGDLKMVTIRENRYPFLHKIGAWNRDCQKTGDTLVEKCCHFFDLFRLITGKEVKQEDIRALAQRGLNYRHEKEEEGFGMKEMNYEARRRPIIDAAYVILPFHDSHDNDVGDDFKEEKVVDGESSVPSSPTIGCLELCMYAEGSRHQEEIIVTGTKGRLEAYLPENKVFYFKRPDLDEWNDRSVPPPKECVHQEVFDCSDVKSIHGITASMPTHGGYHYCSTAVEWYHLIQCMKEYKNGGVWSPHVSLLDGLRAVEAGLNATLAIVNEKNV